jgi:hypothetical protein
MITYYDNPYIISFPYLAFRPKCDTNTDFMHKVAPDNRLQPLANFPVFHYRSLVFPSYTLWAVAKRQQIRDETPPGIVKESLP